MSESRELVCSRLEKRDYPVQPPAGEWTSSEATTKTTRAGSIHNADLKGVERSGRGLHGEIDFLSFTRIRGSDEITW